MLHGRVALSFTDLIWEDLKKDKNNYSWNVSGRFSNGGFWLLMVKTRWRDDLRARGSSLRASIKAKEKRWRCLSELVCKSQNDTKSLAAGPTWRSTLAYCSSRVILRTFSSRETSLTACVSLVNAAFEAFTRHELYLFIVRRKTKFTPPPERDNTLLKTAKMYQQILHSTITLHSTSTSKRS